MTLERRKIMNPVSRRQFLEDVGRGTVVATLGTSLATDMGLGPAWAGAGADRLSFGRLDPLVNLLQETPPNRILTVVTQRLGQGTDLRDLVAAAALANARTFGGEDYVGFHTMMAIAPSYHMAQEMPAARRALPVLKVLYRNSNRIHERTNPAAQLLRPVTPAELPADRNGGELLRDAGRRRDLAAAERTFAALARGNAEDAFNQLLCMVEDGAEVHRVVLPHRAWDLMGIIGRDHAHTLLRQSVHYCISSENPQQVTYFASVRQQVPQLLDEHRLLSRPLGARTATDAWIGQMCRTIFTSTPAVAAGAVAGALAEGFAPDALGEAITLAANQLILRDNGRPANQTSPNRGVGSVHGDSIGVHGCDSANAWRTMSRATNQRNKILCLLLGAWQVARDRTSRGGEFLRWEPYPRAEARQAVTARAADVLLRQAEEAIRAHDQARATAVVQQYGDLGHPDRPLFDLLLRYAISEDGALHAEKFYRTVREEYATTRAAFRWRHVVALARVTASAYGQPAPGYEEACRLLHV
jgi:hypothetical protein